MMKRRTFICALVALPAGLALGACATDQPVPSPVAQVGFQHLPAMRLNVAEVRVSSEYQSPLKAPNVEHLFATPPQHALFDWAKTRLIATHGSGNQAIAHFVVEDAHVVETRLPKTEGLKGMFTYEPTERFDARVVARLKVSGGTDRASGRVRVTSERSIEVSENATLAEREQAWMDLLESIMADFNAQMDTEIQAYLARWLN